ncbi:PHP domain-containing protein [Candidatus Woesearchaeota archaeon]|jgi:predicted metal-dependent phosphoesterase TrpH|nr:PHP domain-containing protein [Candidatus Woesearchaeota archaeon]
MWVVNQLKRLSYGRPDLDLLARKGYMLVDMHVHTNVSDGTCSPNAVVQRAKELGIGVAISDHDKILGSVKSYDNEYNVPVIPSIEVEANTGEHFLYYFGTPEELKVFYKDEIKGRECRRSVFELLDLKKRYNCLVSWAHPAGAPPNTWFSWRKKKITFNLKKIDCLELLNGLAGVQHLEKVASWIMKHRKAFTGGSDAHEKAQIGRVVTYAKAKNIQEFLEKVRKKQARVIGERINFLRFAAKYPFKLVFAKFNYFMKF